MGRYPCEVLEFEGLSGYVRNALCLLLFVVVILFVGGHLAPSMCALQGMCLDGYLGEFCGSCSSCSVGGVLSGEATPSFCVVLSFGPCSLLIFMCGPILLRAKLVACWRVPGGSCFRDPPFSQGYGVGRSCWAVPFHEAL